MVFLYFMKRTIPPQKKFKLSNQQIRLGYEAFRSSSHLMVSKLLITTYKLELAVYISNLCDKQYYFIEKSMLTDDGGFFLTHEDQIDQTGMTMYQLRKCKNQLKELGVLFTEMRGIPRKEFYFFNMEKLIEITLGICHSDSVGLAISKPDGQWSGFGMAINNTISNNNNNISTKSPSTAFITPSMFEDFWKVYPKKTDKGKALTIWKKICQKGKDRPTWKEIKKAILRQIKSSRWQDPKFIPHPTTWLNQSRWLDDPAEMKSYDKDNSSKLSKEQNIDYSYGDDNDHPMHTPWQIKK